VNIRDLRLWALGDGAGGEQIYFFLKIQFRHDFVAAKEFLMNIWEMWFQMNPSLPNWGIEVLFTVYVFVELVGLLRPG
jgi:hypothetical protein